MEDLFFHFYIQITINMMNCRFFMSYYVFYDTSNSEGVPLRNDLFLRY